MIELVVLGATLAIAAGASGARARRRALAARTLERYARWRAHLYVPPARAKESPRVEGASSDVHFVIDLVKIEGHLKTRVRAPVAKGPGAKLAIVQRSAIGRVLLGGHREETSVGIDAFDHAYRIHGVAPGLARAWLEAAIDQLAILDERRDVWLGSDGATVTLTWSDVERNPLLLDVARDVVVSLASWHQPDRPYR